MPEEKTYEKERKVRFLTMGIEDPKMQNRVIVKLRDFFKLMEVQKWIIGYGPNPNRGFHLHALFEGLWLDQRSWSSLLKVWSYGSYYVDIRIVNPGEDYNNRLKYVEEHKYVLRAPAYGE